jgi:hypothetical protein
MILIINYTNPIPKSVKASSSLNLNTEQDFSLGSKENVFYTYYDEIILTLNKYYIEDGFADESKIDGKNNVILNSQKNELKLNITNNITFFKNYGGNDDDNSNSVTQTLDGGYIIVGSTVSFNGGDNDIWLIKTNNYGIQEWNKIFGGNNIDHGKSVQQTLDGGYILTGSTMSYGAGGFDVWVIKTDQFGNMQWNKTYGGNKWDYGYSIQQTSDTGFIITGFTYSFGSGFEDIWLIKINNLGNIEWNKSFGGSKYDRGNSVKQTLDGGYIITGYTESYGNGSKDMWLIKTNNSGVEEWNKTFGGIDFDRGLSVQQSNDGGYIITGSLWQTGIGPKVWLIKTNTSGNESWNKTFDGHIGTSVIETQKGNFIITGGLGTNALIIKTDNKGTLLWNRNYGGNNKDLGNSLYQTSDGGYIVAGYTESYGNGLKDVWLIKTDEQGLINSFNGSVISTNLLKGINVTSLLFFNCTTKVPLGTNIMVQFSQDKINWYNSIGKLNEWDNLNNLLNSLNLSFLQWYGNSFFYRMNFSSDGINIPILKNINVSFDRYPYSGIFESKPYEFNEGIKWNIIEWNGTEPINTNIRIQLRTSNTASGLDLKEFLGPDGTATTYYQTSGNPIWHDHNNDKWMQYRVYLSTLNTSKTPILKQITIHYNYFPELISPNVTPIIGDITDEFNFSVNYLDKDNDSPEYIKICIDGSNYSMLEQNSFDIDFSNGKIYYYSTDFKAGNHTYQFFTSDGDIENITDKWIFEVAYGPLDHIKIEPSSSTITTDDYQIFMAKGFDIDKNLISISPFWEISGGGVIDQNGNFTATKPGTWIVYANVSGVSGKTIINITQGNLSQIKIKPELVAITTDDFLQFTAIGLDNDDNILPIYPYWESSGGGIINQNGTFEAITPGEWKIYANYSEKSGNATIIVKLGKLARIQISPTNQWINSSESIHFIAKGYDNDNNEIIISSKLVVNGGGIIYSNGTFIGTQSGTWIIYCYQSDISANTTINIYSNGDGNKTNENKNEKNSYVLYVGIGTIILIIILISILYFFVIKKKQKIDKNNKISKKNLDETEGFTHEESVNLFKKELS